MAGVTDLGSVQNIDFFAQVGQKLRRVSKGLDKHEISEAFAAFDHAEIGYIKAYYLVNVLHRHCPDLFSDSEMVGLQYELESLSYDGTVDYNEFIRLFMGQEKSSKRGRDDKLKLDVKRSVYSMQDYEDILGKI